MSVSPPRAHAWRATPDGLLLAVRLTPKAGRDEVTGLGDGPDGPHLVVKVRAVPEKGRANAALEAVVADWLDIARGSVSLWGGEKSRLKTLRVSGDAGELAARLHKLLGS